MNKKYIKRQLTLHELGLPISEDIKEYYAYFHQLIGNVDELKKIDITDSHVLWHINDEAILEYNKGGKFFWISYYRIWEKFLQKEELNDSIIDDLFSAFLEKIFDLEVRETFEDDGGLLQYNIINNELAYG